MKLKTTLICLIVWGFNSYYSVYAQTPTDGLMMGKGEICFAVIYERGEWDQYWEGSYLRGNGNIGTFTRSSLMPMLAFGVTDRVNLIVSIPYVKTSATGGQLAGAEGMQDLALSVKAELIRKNFGSSSFSLFSNLSFSTPASDYLSDYLPFSIGLGANELGLRAIGEYSLNQGLYVRGSFAYLHRGTTEAERDYYYNEGSYYTSTMDVPDALHAQLAVGHWFFNKSLRVEVSFTRFHSVKGDDIRAYNSPQPTNKVEFDRVEGFAQYYLKSVKGLGVLGYYNQMTAGRNMGKFGTFGLGLTYQFNVYNK